MKRSNIIILCIVVIAISWLLINGRLQANAYNIIKSGKACSYAIVSGQENEIVRHSYKNIKIDVDKISLAPSLLIKYGKDNKFSYSNSLKNAIEYYVNKDTLYIKIRNYTFGNDAFINIFAPKLNSVNLKTKPDTTPKYKNSGLSANISGFKCNTLSITNMGQNNLRLYDNKLSKLIIKGNFYKGKEIEISKSTECDSLDIDIEGQDGSLIIGNSYFQSKQKPMKWSSIKVPETFRIAAKATIASKIILKK